MQKINAKLAFGVVFVSYLDFLALIDMVTSLNLLRADFSFMLIIVGFFISGFAGSKLSKGYDPENNDDPIFTGVLIALGLFLIFYLVRLM